MDNVLNNLEAIAALRDGESLESAFEISRPTGIVFQEALFKAKRNLTRARAHLLEGYDESESLLRIAGSIALLADEIYSEMEQKRNPAKRKRLTEK